MFPEPRDLLSVSLMYVLNQMCVQRSTFSGRFKNYISESDIHDISIFPKCLKTLPYFQLRIVTHNASFLLYV